MTLAAKFHWACPWPVRIWTAIAGAGDHVAVDRVGEVSRNWPNTITDRPSSSVDPVLAVLQPEGYVLVDMPGLAYQTQPSLPHDVVLADVRPGTNRCSVEVALSPSVAREAAGRGRV